MRRIVAALALFGCSERPLPFPEETRPLGCGEGLTTCLDGPRGAVVSTEGPDDCFAEETDGEVWPSPDGSVMVCGDLTRVFGEVGTLTRTCGDFDQRMATPSCTMTSATLGQRLYWNFSCVVDGRTCRTALVFEDLVR